MTKLCTVILCTILRVLSFIFQPFLCGNKLSVNFMSLGHTHIIHVWEKGFIFLQLFQKPPFLLRCIFIPFLSIEVNSITGPCPNYFSSSHNFDYTHYDRLEQLSCDCSSTLSSKYVYSVWWAMCAIYYLEWGQILSCWNIHWLSVKTRCLT